MRNPILIVDDQKETCELFKEMLGQRGYQNVVTASDAKEGLNVINQQRPNLVLLDVLMPGMDGFMFFKTVRANPQTKDIPVVVITARDKMKDTFLAMGAAGFFAKPFDPETLLMTVKKLSEINLTQVRQDPLSARPAGPGKKALVFGYHYPTLEGISSDLQSKGYATTIVEDEAQVADYAGAVGFDLAVLELYFKDENGIDQVIERLRAENRQKKANPEGSEIPIVIYKNLASLEGVAEYETVDIDNLLDRCKMFDDVTYIGEYMKPTFLFKVKGLVK